MQSDNLRFEFILKRIEEIEEYINEFNSITKMLSSHKEYNATLMCLLQIGEVLNKLTKKYEELDAEDIKGAYDVRNFIAHDYDGVRKSIIEDILRYFLPKLKETIIKINKDEI